MKLATWCTCLLDVAFIILLGGLHTSLAYPASFGGSVEGYQNEKLILFPQTAITQFSISRASISPTADGGISMILRSTYHRSDDIRRAFTVRS